MAPLTPNAPPNKFVIESQVEQYGTDAAGRPAEGVRVGFITEKGIRRSVFIPRDQYRPDIVKATVQAEAAKTDLIHGLTGP